MSIKRREYLLQHPEKVPYILNHHSKGDSYPEKYFKGIFDKYGIEYKQNYYCEGYFLDFAFPNNKTYIEIDGEQHFLDKRIVEHDKIRTQKLKDAGWTCIARVRWSEYQRLDDDERMMFVYNLLHNIECWY